MEKKGLVAEFKEFIMRGNVLDMAVGVIIGGAFGSIVSSIVDDILMPLITMITGGINFDNWFLPLDGNTYATLAAAKEAGASTLNYGVFITKVINFLIVAFCIFMMIKAFNKAASLAKKEEEPAPEAPTTKTCPFCKNEIPIEAVRCGFCTSVVDPAGEKTILASK
ncbi:MAG TPA: large conductance mechanosensitive channel protein MscL [Lachnospiraceae bacterium]|nr:large conductance mechanosensitive channel protein MscL [Lachnospiraceae bacterium]HAV27650.1 large conductance mechanosensitive channel protein MscL [Lachnospiraceae bacterium]